MKVYVAGGSSERLTDGRPLIDRLIAAGVEVTHDWTRCEGYDRESVRGERSQWASSDLEGVRMANVVWYVAPVEKSEGSHAELGAGIVLGKTVIVSGPAMDHHGRIFTLIAASRLGSHEQAFDTIIMMHRAFAASSFSRGDTVDVTHPIYSGPGKIVAAAWLENSRRQPGEPEHFLCWTVLPPQSDDFPGAVEIIDPQYRFEERGRSMRKLSVAEVP